MPSDQLDQFRKRRCLSEIRISFSQDGQEKVGVNLTSSSLILALHSGQNVRLEYVACQTIEVT